VRIYFGWLEEVVMRKIGEEYAVNGLREMGSTDGFHGIEKG
jgi:hypothetical protein